MSKIFRVEITFDVWVEAEDTEGAIQIAWKHANDECTPFSSDVIAQEIESTASVDPEVKELLPYRNHSGPDETIGEILARNAAEK